MAWFKSKTEKLADNRLEEKLYAEAAIEVADNNISPGLWAKAFAQMQGDEQRAKALYIKLRVEQLRSALTRPRRPPLMPSRLPLLHLN